MLYESELRRYEKWLKLHNEDVNDYVYKSYVLKNNIQRDVGIICKNEKLNILYNAFSISEYYQFSWDTIKNMYDGLADMFGYSSLLESLRINNAKYHRVSRLKKRVGDIISTGSSIFLTLTFTDSILSTTSDVTRRRYVHYFLKSISTNYVANIDFGSRNHREHYHALVNCDSVSHKLWRYGAINFERVSYDNSLVSDKLSLYIAKLSNHAIKETTKRSHLIYSKSSPI